jgi:hypothetical protein
MRKDVDQHLLGFRAEEEAWNSLAAFGFGALRKMPDGTMISGDPSAGYTTSTGLPWSFSSTRL